MNILFISYDYPPYPGGIANVSFHMAQELNNMGERIIILAQKAEGDREFDKNNKFLTYRHTNIFFLRELVLVLLLPYFIVRYKINIIYLLMWCQGGIATFLTSKLLHIPYILHAHGAEFLDYKNTLLDKIKYSLFRKTYKRLIFKNAKSVIAVSNFTKDIVIKSGARECNVEVVYNGVDTDRFRPDLDAAKIISRHNLNNKRVLLTVSRLDEYKGIDIIIRLIPQLFKKIPNIIYIIVGSGTQRYFLESLVKELNLQKQVIFAGYVDEADLPLYYNACDIFIMTTRENIDRGGLFEGFGLTFLEANSCCKVVIGGRTGGIPDVIVDGVTGYLVNPDNSQEIIDKVILLLENKEHSRALGEEGRNRIIREAITWKSMARKVLGILHSEIKEVKPC